ncbi:Exocyst complex protein exo70 [Golovinomyces cichoracearum]|uniref:Exocyst complex protein EXO70 n=1 Tax=Golovinomyces cichoracearum TaxID=62708 RepID=A0A420IP68_9PEZI|nr:Exocyst complex protein exo70 [Golovinomyces cichoracearum]
MRSRQLAEDEMRAEVEVLESRLEKTRILNKKLAVSLARLEANGSNVQNAISPLYGDTKKLQVLVTNLDGMMNAIEKICQPSDIKSGEEEIIRSGPEKAGLSSYLNSVKRISKALVEMRQTNLRSNSKAVAEISRLLKNGHQQLEGYFRKILLEESVAIEPLHYITKEKPFPVISSARSTRLCSIISYMLSANKQAENQGQLISKVYSSVRGPYVLKCLQNLASATVQTLKKKSINEFYLPGTNGVAIYAKGIELAFLAEYDNTCALFPRDERAKVFNATCQGSITELIRTIRDINNHIKANLNTDCFLAYEVLEVMSNLSSSLETKTGELKPSFVAALKPIHETAKSSLGELLENIRSTILNMPVLPADGAAVSITTETMVRLQTMTEYLRPISNIMISIGNKGWNSTTLQSSTDQAPTLTLYDVGADGQHIFSNYGADTIDTLLESLEQRGKLFFKTKSTFGVFVANNASVIERLIRGSVLQSFLSTKIPDVEKWRKSGESLYTQAWREPAANLFDKSYTNRPSASSRQSSVGTSAESVMIVKGLSSKEKDGIKEKFRLFNASFEELVTRHKVLNMEKEVREELARQVQQMIEPLYGRFWDRYHEIDKGRGKYAKYDKGSISAVFLSLA